ncbi:MAG: hypothetical protein DME65_09120 [Verrucomicrobia bacterium]|nr:MAG: hypothetical protein DME65_09120 [Verrucomicrobiota bacterium]
MFLRRPDDILSVRRNLQILAALAIAADIAQQTRLGTAHIRGPCLLLGHFWQALRICGCTFLIRLAPARVHNRLAIRRQPQARDLLPIIARVVGYLSRHELRRAGHPDVALAFVVEHPGYTERMRRAG